MERRSNLEAKVSRHTDSDIDCVLHLSTETLMSTMVHSLTHRLGMIASVTIQGLTKEDLLHVGRAIIRQATELADDQAKAAEAEQRFEELVAQNIIRWSPVVRAWVGKASIGEEILGHTSNDAIRFLSSHPDFPPVDPENALIDARRRLSRLIEQKKVYFNTESCHYLLTEKGSAISGGEFVVLGSTREESAKLLLSRPTLGRED